MVKSEEELEYEQYKIDRDSALGAMLCSCGAKAIWNYAPHGHEWGRCDDCARKPCSCNLRLKKDIEVVWGFAENGIEDIINPEEDYEFKLDEDGRNFPCCEFELIEL